MSIKIPKKPREFVIEYAEKIQPLLMETHQQSRDFLENGGKVFLIKNNSDHFNQSYPWDSTRICEVDNLVEVSRITTYHTFGYYGFFKPSLSEVIRQIPDDLLNQVEFFLVLGPDDASDLNKQKRAINKGFHQATTILYRKDHGINNTLQ